jgi:hypothetical protein
MTQPKRIAKALRSMAVRKPFGRSISIATGRDRRRKKIEP